MRALPASLSTAALFMIVAFAMPAQAQSPTGATCAAHGACGSLCCIAGRCSVASVCKSAYAAADSPVTAAGRARGSPCAASAYGACVTGCCFNGTCAARERCFGDWKPNDGTPCSASSPDQCDSGCCFNGTCSSAASCFGPPSGGPVGFTCSRSMDFSQCLSGCCFNSTCHSLDKCFGVPITVAAVLGTASSKTARQTASACAVNKPPGPACACWRDETAVIVDGLACACDQVRACGICIPASAHGIDIAAFIRDNPQYCAQPAFRTDFAQALGTYYDAEFAKPNGNVNDTSELWTGPTTTKTPMNTTTKAALQKTLSNLIQDMDGNIPAVWVGIWDPAKGWAIVSDGLAWTKANATNMTEATNATNATTVDHSRIGSCTKTFVATEILKLVDVGRIKLTDTVSVLLPHVAKAHSYTADVTLGELIGMRSGFPDYAAVDPIINDAWNNPSKIYTADELIRAGLANATARGDATYSNTNYIMLGEIARNLTGQTIFDLVTRNVRVKGLTDTALPKPGDRAMPAPFSRGYNYAFGQFSLAIQGLEVELGSEQQDDVTSWGQAAGAMYSTVADLGKWAGTALGTAELSKATAAARLAFRPINGGSIMYGLGMESFGSGWIGHDGQAIGWETRTAYNTETGGAAVIIVNESGSLSFAVKAMKEWLPGMIV